MTKAESGTQKQQTKKSSKGEQIIYNRIQFKGWSRMDDDHFLRRLMEKPP
jgi:hypothetical protein